MVCEISELSRAFHTCSDGISSGHTSLAIFLFLFVHIVFLLLTMKKLAYAKGIIDCNHRHHFSAADPPVDCNIDL